MDPNLRELAKDHYRELEIILMRKQFEIGDWYYKLGHHKSAYLRFREVITRYGHLRDFEEKKMFSAAYKMLVSTIRLKNREFFKEAKQLITAYEDNPDYNSADNLIQGVDVDKWEE